MHHSAGSLAFAEEDDFNGQIVTAVENELGGGNPLKCARGVFEPKTGKD